MNKYTIFCTQEQTEKAFKLGAPIDEHPFDAEIIKYNEKLFHNIICIDSRYYLLPTSEQMCEWLRTEKDLFVEPYLNGECCYSFSPIISTSEDGEIIHLEAKNTYKEAILAGIDSALNYLLKN